MTPLPRQKTGIVATIGPASDSPDMLRGLIRAGMRVARLNFSHGEFEDHARRIAAIRGAAEREDTPVAVMADLPGPKIRLGTVVPDPWEVRTGESLILTVEDAPGTDGRVTVTFDRLPLVVARGDVVSLNDGLVRLRVDGTDGADVRCTVVTGGELRSRKGLNLPGLDLGIAAFTPRDRACLEFALAHGADAVSQSFVETAADVAAVRDAARALGHAPFLVAKIERAGALTHIDDILAAADGLMVARGDLGVEVPIERIALIQKDLIARANAAGKPVITATQMLESMVASRLPTRAEATDVANAILDGTDCVMLSAESAIGRYPEDAVRMLADIATATESGRPAAPGPRPGHRHATLAESAAALVDDALAAMPAAAVIVPTRTGTTARRIAALKPPVWIVALSEHRQTCQNLLFSYGIRPVLIEREPDDWRAFTSGWLRAHGIDGTLAMLVAGPSAAHPEANHRIEFMRLDRSLDSPS